MKPSTDTPTLKLEGPIQPSRFQILPTLTIQSQRRDQERPERAELAFQISLHPDTYRTRARRCLKANSHSREPRLPLLPFGFLPFRNPLLFAISIRLKIIGTHIPFPSISMQTFQTPIRSLLTRVKVLSRTFTLKFGAGFRIPWGLFWGIFGGHACAVTWMVTYIWRRALGGKMFLSISGANFFRLV